MNFALFIRLAGIAQLGILIASALVPSQLDWKSVFATLPKLHRQMYWTYGGYVVLAIIFNGVVCLAAAPELVSGSLLGRIVCGYLAIFWGVRLCLQSVFDVKPFLKTWWLRAGYHLLSLLFATFTALFAYAVLR
jgi:hypothetical protein